MPPKSKAPPLTHFLCLPLATPQSTPALSANLHRFAESLRASTDAPQPRAQDPTPTPAAKGARDDRSPSSSTPAGTSGVEIPPSAVRPAGTIHLTLGVMSLRTAERLDAARARLRSLDLAALLHGAAPAASDAPIGTAASSGAAAPPSPPPPLVVRLRGLRAMQTPHRTSVLYAEPHDASGRLPRFCQRARGAFAEAGLVVDEGRALKLHATILNTVYARGEGKRRPEAGREGSTAGPPEAQDGGEVAAQDGDVDRARFTGQRDGGGKRGRRGRLLQFDGRELIERWKDELWVEVQVEKLAICEMGAKEDEHGEVRYVEVEAKEFP